MIERDGESEAESIRSLRELLRSGDEKMRRDAARYLLALLKRREQRGRVPPHLCDSFEMLDHGDLERHLSVLEHASGTGGGSSDGGPKPTAK